MTRPGSTQKLYPGTDHLSYRSLKELIRVVRITGERDDDLGRAMDDCFIDNKRVMVGGETDGWNTIAEYMKPPDPRNFRRNPWQDQPDRIHIWVEKDTLRGLIQGPCFKWDVTQVISMGTFGRTILMRAGDRIAAAIKSGCRRVWIGYVGDWDATGLAIEDWAQYGNDKDGNRRTEGLREIMMNRHGWTHKQYEVRIVFRRIAVTEDDFHNPQLEPMKISVKDAGRDEETGKCKKGHDPGSRTRKDAAKAAESGGFSKTRLRDARLIRRHSTKLAEAVLKGTTPLDEALGMVRNEEQRLSSAESKLERLQKRAIQNWITSH